MHQYDRSDKRTDEFDWSDEEDFDFLDRQFEPRSGRLAFNRKVDARRRIEDYQEKRRLRRRVRLSLDSWDDSGELEMRNR